MQNIVSKKYELKTFRIIIFSFQINQFIKINHLIIAEINSFIFTSFKSLSSMSFLTIKKLQIA